MMILDEDINKLELNSNIILILRNNHINKIKDLWILKRNYLKSIGLNDSQIRDIVIKMQLHGIDLNRRSYSKY